MAPAWGRLPLLPRRSSRHSTSAMMESSWPLGQILHAPAPVPPHMAFEQQIR